jgi:single-strand DNA-binding protein
MNKSILMGRITKDLELKTSQAGTSFLSFTLAVNRQFVKQGEERQADFISCKAFGKTAENIAKFFLKGSLIAIEGRIQTGSYDNKEGQKVYTTDIMIDNFHFTGEKKQDKAENTGWVAEAVANTTDELPF